MWDAVVIGAGVTGSAVARYLSRYRAKVLVVENSIRLQVWLRRWFLC